MVSNETPSPFDAVLLDGVPNFRDIGGYATTDGRFVRPERVYRSGMLGVATEVDLETMETLGLRTVIDLRTDAEVDVFGRDRLPRGASLVRLPIPSAGPDPAMVKAMESGGFPYVPDLAQVNRGYIADDARQIGDVLELLSKPANLPAAVHCLGGKDRTGVVTAILLTILEVPWETVRADYLRSNEYYRETLGNPQNAFNSALQSRLRHPPGLGNEEAKRDFFELRSVYIDAVLDETTKDSQSFGDFVNSKLGLADTTVDRLRSELLE